MHAFAFINAATPEKTGFRCFIMLFESMECWCKRINIHCLCIRIVEIEYCRKIYWFYFSAKFNALGANNSGIFSYYFVSCRRQISGITCRSLSFFPPCLNGRIFISICISSIHEWSYQPLLLRSLRYTVIWGAGTLYNFCN